MKRFAGLLAVVALAGCGGGSDEQKRNPADDKRAAQTAGAELEVTLGYPTTKVIEFDCVPGRPDCTEEDLTMLRELLRPENLAARACTEQYGGPEVAVVKGTVEGKRVTRDRITRINGCEIADYAALMDIIGGPASEGAAQPAG